MRTFSNTRSAALIVCAALCLPTAANAAILAIGPNALTGTTSALEPQLAGTVVEDEITAVSFTIGSGTFSANVQSRVVLSDDGTYDFYWRVRDTTYDGTDPAAMGSFRIGDFGIPTAGLNGNYRLDGLGNVGPDSAFVFGAPNEDFVNFNFNGGMRAGNETYFMLLDTQATRYARTAVFDLTNVGQTQISDSYSTFGVAEIPEPGAWLLMIAGFGLSGAMLRGRSRAAAGA